MTPRIEAPRREQQVKKIASATDPLWYKDAVIYEIHVRAFSDSNGDGIGDFPGLLTKLDYLQDLGVTCIWLLPFFPSPLRDDGYDISNYVDVNPSYGTLNEFKTFLDAAHQHNMQVMIELVINHTSDQHPWFKAARLAPQALPNAQCMSGPTAISITRMRASFLPILKNQIGRGMRQQRHITGTVSFHINPI